MAKRVVLAGGSGFIGRSLADELVRRDYAVTILSRTPRASGGRINYLVWDGVNPGDWAPALDGAAAVVNLAGRSINCIHTAENRREIIASRVNSVRAIDAAIARCAQPPAVLLQAGSLGLYGNAGDRVCDEEAPHGGDFLAGVCEQWEAAFAEVWTPRTRRALLRVGLVLGREGGALQPLAKLARCFLGGTVGSGHQYMSWLHLDDLTEMFIRAIECPEIAGAYNATGPAPVTNAEFMRELRRAVGRPWSAPAPAFMVRLGARWIMRTDADLALTGQRCMPRRFLAQGFRFRFNDLPATLHDLFETCGNTNVSRK
jgi:uncharacterized protein (TIGR01777 family)